MDSSLISAALGLFMGLIGGLGWLFRLENRTANAKSHAKNNTEKFEEYAKKTDARLAGLYDQLIAIDKRAYKHSIVFEQVQKDLTELKDFIKGEGFTKMKKDLTHELVLELRKNRNV